MIRGCPEMAQDVRHGSEEVRTVGAPMGSQGGPKVDRCWSRCLAGLPAGQRESKLLSHQSSGFGMFWLTLTFAVAGFRIFPENKHQVLGADRHYFTIFNQNRSKKWCQWCISLHVKRFFETVKSRKLQRSSPRQRITLLLDASDVEVPARRRCDGGGTVGRCGIELLDGNGWKWMEHDVRYTDILIWQCVKTNSTPVVHIKIAGIYGCE